MRFYKRIFVFVSIFMLLGIAISACSSRYFYYPDQNNYGYTPDRLKQAYEHVRFKSTDGTQLTGWFVPSALHTNPKDAVATVIHIHGNAGNLSAHYGFVDWLPQEGFNVFIFDYRGFGLSEGKPNFKGVFEDTDSAIHFIRSHPKVNPERLLVLSQSLGGNNAIAAIGAGNSKGIKALVVDSTFYSYSSIANDKLWGSGLFLSNTYSGSRYVSNLAPIPVLFLHGTQDSVIPSKHSEKLYTQAKEPKELLIIPGKEHITALNDETYRRLVAQFFIKHLDTNPQTTK